MTRASASMELEVVTEPLGGSSLSLAAQRGGVPERWYRPRPADAEEWRAAAQAVAEGFSTGEWLSALQPAIDPSGVAADRLRKVVRERGVVVTTGQQPGLFGGPTYTFSKALTVLALADELEARIGLPVAPIFWAATDDADFHEASWTKVVSGGAVVRLAVHDAPPSGTPMSAAPLGDVTEELAALERASGSGAFAVALDAARRAYSGGTTVGDAFTTLLRALLQPLGIAVLDASHPVVRRQGATVLREALSRAAEIASALRARATELRGAGFEPQVVDVEDLSLVFSLHGGRKRRIPIEEAATVDSSVNPETLSPNVLLRPLVERVVLPTVAYAAGPAELAYFAQVSAVADSLGVERPLAVPRWSCTVIEPHVGRILRHLDIRHTDLRDPHALEGILARDKLPATVASALDRTRDAIERAVATLQSDADASSLVPGAAVSGARGSLFARLERLERRYVAAVKRREADLMRQVATARAHLFPDAERQERALNFIPMLARQGPALVDAMRNAAATHAAQLIGDRSAPVRPEAEAVRGGGSRS